MNKNTIERKLELRTNKIVNKIHLINFFLTFFSITNVKEWIINHCKHTMDLSEFFIDWTHDPTSNIYSCSHQSDELGLRFWKLTKQKIVQVLTYLFLLKITRLSSFACYCYWLPNQQQGCVKTVLRICHSYSLKLNRKQKQTFVIIIYNDVCHLILYWNPKSTLK